MQQIHNRFLGFLEELFISYRYEVEVNHGPGDGGVDIVLKYEGLTVVVETKVYRTKQRPPIKNALAQINFVSRKRQAHKAVLIITSIVEPGIRQDLYEEYGVVVWDRSVLFYLTNESYALREELEQILSELKQSGEEDIHEGVYEITDFDINQLWGQSIGYTNGKGETTAYHANASPSIRGRDLCSEMQSIPVGKPGASAFENKCEEVLKYLFKEDLSSWTPQNTTDDTLHRFDLIARIISQNDFWRTLARDFKTRYVIFEFKNYTDKITQAQVYTTEKYLYTTALRSFAIIIARNGFDKNSGTAMKGALKENGKLIICLDEVDICKMLKMKDVGDDPNTYLSNILDDILMQLSR